MRLKDLVNKVLNEDPNMIIPWMTEGICSSLKYKRKNDEEFKKRSEINKKNKVEGAKGKTGHDQRSISSTMWLHKLVAMVNLI